MPRFYARAAVWVTLTLLAPCLGPDRVFAASPAGATDTPDKTVPQGNDPPGADNGEQQIPPQADKEVIPPPPIGDEDIYTQAPNPEAGHEDEVIPPPGTPGGDPSVEPR
jgi:hypothetical protein